MNTPWGLAGAHRPHIGFGQVRHTRLRPTRHAFAYRTYFLMLPMRSLGGQAEPAGLAMNRRAAFSFFDTDHGDGRGPAQGGALAWLDESLQRHGIHDAIGETWLHCFPRVLGYTFKPVSFWYCHRADGTLRCIVAEVNNTFGERHCYLLEPARYGVEMHADKVFHVSPFCDVAGSYRFRFMRSDNAGTAGDRTVVRIDHDDAGGPLLQTSVSGRLELLTPASRLRALWGYPALTLMVSGRIHWHALQLWWQRAGFRPKPQPPAALFSRPSQTTESATPSLSKVPQP